MNGPNRDGWLLAAGLLYPVAAFSVLLTVGPLALDPLLLFVPALALAVAAIGLWLGGAGLRWWSVALFVGWLSVVVWLQLLVMASASAAV